MKKTNERPNWLIRSYRRARNRVDERQRALRANPRSGRIKRSLERARVRLVRLQEAFSSGLPE